MSLAGGLVLGGVLGACLPVAAGSAPAPAPIIGCASLVNLRILLRQTRQDTAAAVAILGNDQADHLGCVVLARDIVTGLQEHLTLNGNAYDCLSLRNTSVCHWVVAGDVNFSQPPAKARAGDKVRPGEKQPSASEKARR